VAHPIVADNSHRQASTRGRVVHLWVPGVTGAYVVHHPACWGHEKAANRAEDVGCRVVVVVRAVVRARRGLHREDVHWPCAHLWSWRRSCVSPGGRRPRRRGANGASRREGRGCLWSGGGG